MLNYFLSKIFEADSTTGKNAAKLETRPSKEKKASKLVVVPVAKNPAKIVSRPAKEKEMSKIVVAVKSPKKTPNLAAKKGDVNEVFHEVYGVKGRFDVLRMEVATIIRDSNISSRHAAVTEYKPERSTHNYFLRSTRPEVKKSAHVDHTLECQFLGHCIMQTKCMHPVIRTVEVGVCRTKQPKVVQGMLDPLYYIHNGHDKVASSFNLHLMDANLNNIKGKAVEDFIKRQYSTKSGEIGGPVHFSSYFETTTLVKDGIIDADELSGQMEMYVRDVEDPYCHYLENLQMGGESAKQKAERSEELIQTIIQVYDKMFDGDRPR